MTDTKQKLINLVSALEDENIIDYCYTFIGLKVYGKTRLPESITSELRQMWDKYLVPCGYVDEELDPEQEQYEQTAEEKKAGEYRCDVTRMLYGINNVAILNYIRIIVEDIAKEPESSTHIPDERKETIAELLKEIEGIHNIAKIRFILNIVKNYKKGGVVV